MSTNLLSNLLPNLLARLTLAAVESTHPVQFRSTIQRRSTYFPQHLRAHARSHVQVPVFKSPPRASGPAQRPLARVACNVLSDIHLPFSRFAFCAASSFLSPVSCIVQRPIYPAFGILASVYRPVQCYVQHLAFYPFLYSLVQCEAFNLVSSIQRPVKRPASWRVSCVERLCFHSAANLLSTVQLSPLLHR